MAGIRLSEKHGLNPALGVCFWCGADDTVILFGRMAGDQEAPRRVCLGYDPCPKCKAQFKAGILLFEATDTPAHEGQPAIGHNMYPTGRLLVVWREAIERMLEPPMREAVLKAGRAAMEPEAFAAMQP